MSKIITALALAALIAFPAGLRAVEEEEFDPATVSEADAINCYLDAPSYNGFALSVEGEGGIAAARRWRRIKSGNPFMNEYELPEPIEVTGGYSTRRIAFTSTGILAILDLPDTAALARKEGIDNAADPEPLIAALVAEGKATRAQIEAEVDRSKFLGERVIVDATEPATEERAFGTHTVISRNISTVSTHPGKTFYGCSYRIELLDREGKPL